MKCSYLSMHKREGNLHVKKTPLRGRLHQFLTSAYLNSGSIGNKSNSPIKLKTKPIDHNIPPSTGIVITAITILIGIVCIPDPTFKFPEKVRPKIITAHTVRAMVSIVMTFSVS